MVYGSPWNSAGKDMILFLFIDQFAVTFHWKFLFFTGNAFKVISIPLFLTSPALMVRVEYPVSINDGTFTIWSLVLF
jgi:hypothetical protein